MQKQLLIFVLALRNARNSFGGLRNITDWWDWSLTTLLDSLYPGGSPTTRVPGAQVSFPSPLHLRDHLRKAILQWVKQSLILNCSTA